MTSPIHLAVGHGPRPNGGLSGPNQVIAPILSLCSTFPLGCHHANPQMAESCLPRAIEQHQQVVKQDPRTARVLDWIIRVVHVTWLNPKHPSVELLCYHGLEEAAIKFTCREIATYADT